MHEHDCKSTIKPESEMVFFDIVSLDHRYHVHFSDQQK